MDTKTKILFTVFIGLVFIAALLSYQRYFIQGNYLITAEVPCDPTREVCFVSTCDPETDEDCTDPEPSYYKQIEGTAHALPSCDPNDETCGLTECSAGSSACRVIRCDADSDCTDPAAFQVAPLEEEAGTPEQQPEQTIE